MFTKSRTDITFSDAEDFCREFGEGVRVEYKREIKDIPKIISSFANTVGGIYIIGAKTNSTNQVIFPIRGIPKRRGIEEQIQQSALTGIYPAVIPEVVVLDIPDTNNVIVIVRVEESIQTPHAIENSTRVYIRVGSITQPYELKLAEIDQIEYMLKRREGSQIVTRQILERTEERSKPLFRTDEPTLTVIIRPIFPYRPLISTGDIYNFARENGLLEKYSLRVTGGVAGGFTAPTSIGSYSGTYWELNEYGIVYHREVLAKEQSWVTDEIGHIHDCLRFSAFVQMIGQLIRRAQSFYKRCEYFGHLEVTARLQQAFGQRLLYYDEYPQENIDRQRSAESEIPASTQYLPRDLVKEEKLINVVDGLAGQLLWAFNIDDNKRREKVEDILRQSKLVDSSTQ